MRKISVLMWVLVAAICASAQVVERKVSIPPLREGESRYFYVPFEVPAGTKSVDVAYSFDEKGGTNSLDLGLIDTNFDPAEQSAKGLRGWSGRRRNEVFISETAASNGYVAGKIPAGTWRVILGRYKIAPGGVEVTIKIKLNQVDEKLLKEPTLEENQVYTLPAISKLPPAEKFNGYQWFRGDLHIHTYHSDGIWTVPMILDWVQASGLDFIGLTDHNTTSHHAEINRLAPNYKNLLVLRGEELTTYGGHINIWGLPTDELIDFRITPKDSNRLQRSIARVHELNLLASINHPALTCGGCDWSYGDWTQMDSVEIWNGVWDVTDESAVKMWDELLQSGKRLTVIGSSDTHKPPLTPESAGGRPIAQPMIHAGMSKLSQNELFSAIRQGRIWISDNPKGYSLEFSASAGKKRFNIGDEAAISDNKISLQLKARNFPADAVLTLISNGQKLLTANAANGAFEFSRDFSVEKNSYYRLEIRDAKNNMLALTNPIYIKIK